MKKEYVDYLEDIINAINDIEHFIEGMDASAFFDDRKTINAVIRSLEIIGEASKKIPENIKKKHPEIPWKSIAGMRDKLIHEYFGVDLGMVWLVVVKEIPELKEKILRIKNELEV